MVQLQEYMLQVEYKPGLHNPADYLSRHARPATKREEQEARETEEYVRLVIEQSRPLPISMEEIERATQEDDCLQVVKTAVITGNWRAITDPKAIRTDEARLRLQSLYHIREELAVTQEECLLRGPRLVIPSSLTQKVVDLAHRSHQGMVKTKNRLRTRYGFPPSTTWWRTRCASAMLASE